MKKIIAAFDGLNFSESTLEEAVKLAKQHDAHLVGVFLQEFTARGFVVYEALMGQAGSQKDLFEELEKEDASTYRASIDTFEAACQEAGVPYSIHKDRRSARRELLHESVFADLLVIDANETFSYIEQEIPGWFLKNILHEAHCPIWLVSKKLRPVEKPIFLYDGSPSSMHAIKMFTYLFPDMSAREALVLSVKSGTLNLHVPDNKLIHEWMKRHYARAGFKVIQGGEEELLNFCYAQGPEVLVVAGAYERNRMSNWLHPSLADQLMRQLKAPLFITHC
ncbi:MAG TPA: universal stress protein [Puia sp.]|nr:universal stress protein [Puia sp.]